VPTFNQAIIYNTNKIIMETLSHHKHHAKEAVSRTLVKPITYRVFILILDFTTIYIFTRQAKIALVL